MKKQDLLDFQIVNVVVSSKLETEVDIDALFYTLNNAQYNPEIWCGLVWRRQNPKSTIILFATGKISCVGTRSEKSAKLALKKAIEALPELSDVHYKEPEVVNVVATADLHEVVDLEKIAPNFENSTTRSALLPCLVHRTEKGTFLVFATGKISLVGAKSEKDAEESMFKFISKVRSIQSAVRKRVR